MKNNKNHCAKNQNSLRIISGLWRGRRLSFPDSLGLRPTPDRVRETIFNWLNPVINNSNCLDLFCGSGALGFEAISRGASSVVFVDSAPNVIGQLKANINLLGCDDASIAVNANALDWLNAEPKVVATGYDIIFLDPPFRKGLLFDVCRKIDDLSLLNKHGYIYLEVEKGCELAIPEKWKIYRQKNAGKVDFYLCTL